MRAVPILRGLLGIIFMVTSASGAEKARIICGYAKDVALFSEKDPTSSISAVLKCGEKVTVLGEEGNWKTIRTKKGKVGFVRDSYVYAAKRSSRKRTLAALQQVPLAFNPIRRENQMLHGAAAAMDGAIGVFAEKVGGGFRVVQVVKEGPVEKAGIRVGDILVAIDGNNLTEFTEFEFYGATIKEPGEPLQITYTRGVEEMSATVLSELRGKVFPEVAKEAPGVSQVIFDGRAAIVVGALRNQSQMVEVWLQIWSRDVPMFTVDEAKFFVLDGMGQQLRRITLDEIKYSIQLWVAQNSRGGYYPPPMPLLPQKRYTIAGTETGNYTVTDLGTMGTISGTSTGSYTVTEEPDYSQMGYTLGLAIRRGLDRRHNRNLHRQAEELLAGWDKAHFRSQSPIIPGENRQGTILFSSGSGGTIQPPLKVILFLTAPDTKKEENIIFEFR